MESDSHLSPMHPDDAPDGYPTDVEQWLELTDGSPMFVRPMIPDDVARIEHAFAVADIETIRRRFFTAAPPTDRAHLEYLANVDYDRRFALLAMDENGNSIGVGRYETTEPGIAEVAIVVDAPWRRRGVGSLLLTALEPIARDHGVTQFLALYLPENKGVERLLEDLGYDDHKIVDGVAVLDKALS